MIVLGLSALGAAAPTPAAPPPIAVVVNRGNPLTNITRDQLREFYLGRSTQFPNRDRVVLLELPTLRGEFYRSVLGMSEDQVKRYWIGVIFAGGDAAPPKEVGNADEVKRYVAEHRGTVAFIAATDVDSTVKPLTVDGRRPNDPEYPIRSVTMATDGLAGQTLCQIAGASEPGC